MADPELDVHPSDPTRIGKYEVVRKLAIGGMAELYLARARGIEGFEKLAVLKRMLPEFTRRPNYVRMFLDEARLAARLQHPSLVQAYDIGEAGGEYFFSMEFVHGHDLRSIMRTAAQGDGVPLDIALSIVISIASGLHYAHELSDEVGQPLNVVHRDVTPSNVLVSFDGHAKLLDFGVAKADTRSEKTKSGTVKGKPGYMSPEQCQGEALDRRSDIFSLGIVLYELTVGQRLFRRDNEFASMTAIVLDEIEPPSSRVDDYLPELERIVMRALEKDPEHRYRTAQQMQIELEELVRKEQLSTSSVKLTAYMEELFAEELRRWKAAKARGRSLAGILADSDGDAVSEDSDSPSYGAAITTAGELLTIESADTVTSHGAIERARPAPSVPAPRATRWWLWLPVVAAVGVAVFFATVSLGGGGGGDTSPSPAEVAPASTPASTPGAEAASAPPAPPPTAGGTAADAGVASVAADAAVDRATPVRRTKKKRRSRSRKPRKSPVKPKSPEPAGDGEDGKGKKPWDPNSPRLP